MVTISMDKYQEIEKFLKEKTRLLWEHENKVRNEKGKPELNMYQEGFSITNYYCCNEGNTAIYFALNDSFEVNVFYRIYKAISIYPNKFGTGNAEDVVKALFKANDDTFLSPDEYMTYIANFACCYIIYETDSGFSNDVLRIDMLRSLMNKKDTPELKEFVGGLLHALTHFSFNGAPLSTERKGADIPSVGITLNWIAQSFLSKHVEDGKRLCDYESIVDINGEKYRFHFYKEIETGIFFLKTFHRQ